MKIIKYNFGKIFFFVFLCFLIQMAGYGNEVLAQDTLRYVVNSKKSGADAGKTAMVDAVYAANVNPGKVVEITFASGIDTVYVAGTHSFVSRTADLIIDGQCSVIFESEGSGFRGFWMSAPTSPSNVIFKGVTIRDFQFAGEGAAIYNAGTLILQNVNLINNQNSGAFAGGAIASVTNSKLRFQNRVFFQNNFSADNYGGAVFLAMGNLTVESGAQAVFLENSAYMGGGAIYSYYQSSITIEDNSFQSLVFTGNKVTATANIGTVTPSGGAILHASTFGNPLVLYGAVFNSNEALGGGAIAFAEDLSSSTSLILYNCSFNGNKATKYNGGAVAVSFALKMDDNCVFTNNRAELNGGAIFYDSPQDLSLFGVFRGNSAGESGGAVLAQNSRRVSDESVRKGTIFLYGEAGGGGDIKRGIYEYNVAENGAGGFLCSFLTSVFLKPTTGDNTLFTGNTAGYLGGALYLFKGDASLTNVTFNKNSQFREDSIAGGGGAIAILGKQADEAESAAVPVHLTLTNAVFNENSASVGGAICSIYERDSIIVNDKTRFFANKAQYSGLDRNLTLREGGIGGAIYSIGYLSIQLTDPIDNTDVFSANFHDNIAKDNGGAIYCRGEMVIDQVYFHQNQAYAGGAISIDSNQPVELKNSLFNGCFGGFGGAVHLNYSGGGFASKFLSQNTIYKGNRASAGGAIHSTNAIAFDLWQNTFDGNYATGDAAGEYYGFGAAVCCYGNIYVGNGAGTGYSNVFKNNIAYNGTATGAAIYTTGIANIQKGNTFTGNLAGKLSNGNVVNGAVIAIGNQNMASGGGQDQILENSILNNSGPMPNLYYDPGQPVSDTNPQYLFDVLSHGIGFHNEWKGSIIGNVEIANNIIQGNNYGVFVPDSVVRVEITQNTFGNNKESIQTLQHSPVRAAKDANAASYGNLGIGMPLMIKVENANSGSVNLTAYLPKSLSDGSRIELYKSDQPLDSLSTDIEYMGDILLSQTERDGAALTAVNFVLPGGTTFDADQDHLLALAIDSAGNTSEFSLNAIVFQVNINEGGFPYNWMDAKLKGTWDTDFQYSNLSEDNFAYYPDDVTIQPVNGDPDSYTGTFYLTPDPADWRFSVETIDGTRLGSWSFDGFSGDTINLETYKVEQNYTFENNYIEKKRLDDYKVLAVVDDGPVNRLRNSKYLSMDNDASGFAGGGGGLLIKKGSTGTVTLSSGQTPIGSTPGKLSAGFVVVEKDVDFVIDGSGAELIMDNSTTNGGTDPVYGSRLIIEKGRDTTGIFSLENSAKITYDSYFMALYHHVLDEDYWSWIGLPESLNVMFGAPLDMLLYTISSDEDQFYSEPTKSGDVYLSIYSYNETSRAKYKPNFGSDGAAWDLSNLQSVNGFITSIKDNFSSKDLYLNIKNPSDMFSNTAKSVPVSFTISGRDDQYQLAAQYLGKGTIPSGYPDADQETRDLVAAYHSGWNLIGNPYSKSYIPDAAMGVVALPSADGSGYTYMNIDQTVLGTKLENGVWSYYPGNDASGFNIPPLTAFFTQLSSSVSTKNITGSFSLDNNLRSSRPEPGIIRIDLLKNDQMESQAVLSFTQGATPVMDWGLDVPLMSTTGTDVYFPDKMGSALAINAVGENSYEFDVPLAVNLKTAGTYQFRISEVKNILADQLYLIDTNQKQEIKEGGIYTFSVNKNGNIQDRFSIQAKENVTGLESTGMDVPYVTASNGSIHLYRLSDPADIVVFDVVGRVVHQTETSQNEYTVPVSEKGNYIIRILQNKQIYTIKTILQ